MNRTSAVRGHQIIPYKPGNNKRTIATENALVSSVAHLVATNIRAIIMINVCRAIVVSYQ